MGTGEMMLLSAAMRRLKVSRTTMLRLIYDGVLEGERKGETGWWYVSRASVERFHQSRSHAAQS